MEGKVIKHFTCKETNEVYNDGDTYETSDKERLDYLAERGYLIIEIEEKAEKEVKENIEEDVKEEVKEEVTKKPTSRKK